MLSSVLIAASAAMFSTGEAASASASEQDLVYPSNPESIPRLLPGLDLIERQETRLEAQTVSPKSEAGIAPARKYALVPEHGGGYVFSGPRFEAHIAADGHVTFTDRRVAIEELTIGPLTFKRDADSGAWSPKWAEPEGAGWSLTQPSPYRPFLDPRQSGPIDPSPPPLLIRVTGRFDLTDEFVRLVSSRSPNRREHARFLADTLEFRSRLAAAHHARRLHLAAGQLPAMLDGIWRDPNYTTREKKRLVCLLWNELGDAERVGSSIASAFTAWIQKRLPASHPDAYTEADLKACNHDGGTFAPYGD